ncbi:hypothetical protein ACNNM0_08300 [Aerococcus viridans]
MNNISRIKKIFESISLSISNNNYFASLTNSLILIDICAKIYSPKETESNKRYKKWIDDNFITKLEGLSSANNYLSSNNIWFLRSAMLHEGSADPTTNKSYQKFGKKKVRDIVPTIFPEKFDKKVLVADQGEEYPTLFFDIIYFCENVLSVATDWVDENTELVKESDLNLFSLAYSEFAINNNLIIFRA